jgi:hypothetical protein
MPQAPVSWGGSGWGGGVAAQALKSRDNTTASHGAHPCRRRMPAAFGPSFATLMAPVSSPCSLYAKSARDIVTCWHSRLA